VKNKMAYLGPRGTFCEEAALRYTEQSTWELLPYSDIGQVFAAVHQGVVDSGIVPIENSCEGSVNQTMDLLAYDYDLKVSGEIILPINHNLLARPGVKLEGISRILSHPQALAQCRRYLTANFEGLELIDVTSTAEAARRVAGSSSSWAAIGTTSAARAYGLDILSPKIQDRPHNETRFIILSSQCSPENLGGDRSYLYKTSLLIYLLNKPGALFQALEQFYLYEINLTKIESRPAQTRIGEYLFFIDIEGHKSDQRIQKALAGLKSITHEIRVLGSYRTASRAACQ
jgi:prephenate dehydratase